MRSGCSAANRCRYHSPGVPSGFVGPGPGRTAEDGLPPVGRQYAVLTPGRAGTRTARGPPSRARSTTACPGPTGARPSSGSGTTSTICGCPGRARRAMSSSASGQRAEDGVDGSVVGDVVAGVGLGRGVPGVEPHRVDAQVGPGRSRSDTYAAEVADAVAVAVGETPRVVLIDHRGAPPRVGRRLDGAHD